MTKLINAEFWYFRDALVANPPPPRYFYTSSGGWLAGDGSKIQHLIDSAFNSFNSGGGLAREGGSKIQSLIRFKIVRGGGLKALTNFRDPLRRTPSPTNSGNIE